MTQFVSLCFTSADITFMSFLLKQMFPPIDSFWIFCWKSHPWVVSGHIIEVIFFFSFFSLRFLNLVFSFNKFCFLSLSFSVSTFYSLLQVLITFIRKIFYSWLVSSSSVSLVLKSIIWIYEKFYLVKSFCRLFKNY